MNDNQFDDIIRNKLSSWKFRGEADWHAFEAKKLKAEAEESAAKFDQNIKQKLADYKKSPKSESWNILNGKYSALQKRKNQVFSIKSLEALILLILMIPFSSNVTESLKKQYSPAMAESASHLQSGIKEKEVLENRTEISIAGTVADSNERPATASNRQPAVDQKSGTLKAENSTFAERQKKGLKNLNGDSQRLSLTESIAHTGMSAEVVAENNVGVDAISENIIAGHGSSERILLPANIKSLKANIDSEFRNIAISFSELSGFQEVNPKIKQDWLHLFGAIENNIINSPVDGVYGIAAHQSYAPGHSLQIKYSKVLGRWELATGLAYAKRKYQPYPISETYEGEKGIRVISLEEIDYDVVSIPLELRYHLLQHEDWSLYVGVGMSGNVLWHAEYVIVDELDIPLPRPPGSEINTNTALLYNKEFETGISGDMPLTESFFLRSLINVGLERKISDRTMFYLGGQYSQQLNNQLGPNNDRINVLSFGAGLKFKL